MSRILIVEDTASLRDALCTVLSGEGFGVVPADSAESALEECRRERYSLILCDLKLPRKTGLDLLNESRSFCPDVPFVIMTAYGSIQTAVDAMKMGASDFITKPFDPQTLCALVHRLTTTQSQPDKSERTFLTQSAAMERVLRQAEKVAPLSSTVMILGESGTGKELLARYIHDHSARAGKPFIAVNCGSFPEELLESEFFGHEAGAFTGAAERRVGLFESASDGTIFLDEIGSMPLPLQVKLLRTLQESEIRRVGGTKTVKVETRVLTATNCDLAEAIKQGSFREDLYYRLGVVILEVPPLRERLEDIEMLASYFLRFYSAHFEHDPRSFSAAAIEKLKRYHWPGNIRELENVIQRAVIFSSQTEIGAGEIELAGQSEPVSMLPEVAAQATREAEMAAICAALEKTNGNKAKASKLLGISYKTLLNKIRDYAIPPVEKRRPA